MKIVVLYGGLSPERNVSASTGIMVCEALRAKGHQAALVDMYFGMENWGGTAEELFAAPLSETGKKISPEAPDLEQVRASRKWKSSSLFGPGVLDLCQMADIVFLALHGACGEDGRVQAALELMGIPYTGAGYLSSAISMDKDMTKRMIAGTGVSTPAWKTAAYGPDDIEALVHETELPCVVKPVDSGSSIGVFIVHTAEELRHALVEGLKLGGKAVIEQYVAGREVQVGILEDRSLPPIEIIPNGGFYDYENKYQPGAAVEVCPAPLDSATEQRLREATETVYRTLGLSVYSRADFILSEDGTPWFLEINTLPGMTPTSLLPQEAAAAGISYEELCERIVQASLRARKEGK